MSVFERDHKLIALLDAESTDEDGGAEFPEDYSDLVDLDDGDRTTHTGTRQKNTLRASDFITNEDYQRIVEAVKNKAEFEFEKVIKKIRIEILSSVAACNFTGDTVEKDDYIVCDGFSRLFGDYHGFGSPYSPEEFSTFTASYQTFLEYICGRLRRVGEDATIGELDRQKSLF